MYVSAASEGPRDRCLNDADQQWQHIGNSQELINVYNGSDLNEMYRNIFGTSFIT
jgi:hypothetical protein